MRVAFFLVFHLLIYGAFSQLIFNDQAAQWGIQPTVTGDAHGSGIAIADFDMDGDLDLYVCAERGFADELYRNEGSTFTPIAAQVGLGSNARSRMALWIDYDGDHDLDLLVSGDCDFDTVDCPGADHFRLYRNDAGQFVNVTVAAGLRDYSPVLKDQTMGGLAAADVNGDGHVDFVQAVRKGRLELFINKGDGTFTEQNADWGFIQRFERYYQPMFYDFNRDGYIDLYANVDFGPNQLWINEQGRKMNEQGFRRWADSDFNEMGMTLGDFDNDGDMDVYSTNIANYLGQDVHNILLRNDFNPSEERWFVEIAEALDVDRAGWGWGATFFDADNNGFLDLATTNGWNVPFETIDQSKIWIRQTNGTLQDLSDSVAFNDNLNASVLIAADLDRDGDLDMVQGLKEYTNPGLPLRLLMNEMEEADRGNYLVVKPRMTGKNHFAVGAEVIGYQAFQKHSRLIHAGTSFYGQEPYEAFIGLGNVEVLDSLQIIWPGGASSWWYDVPANQILELTDEGVLHRPGLFTAQLSSQGVLLSWRDLTSTEDNYVLEKSLVPNFTEIEQINLSENTESYMDAEVSGNTQYYYRLKAVNASSESLYAQTSIEFIPLSTKTTSHTKIFPNPIKAGSVLKLEGLVQEKRRIDLYDMRGVKTCSIISGMDNVVVIPENLSGLYLLMIEGERVGRILILPSD